jgi:hypothetical protein
VLSAAADPIISVLAPQVAAGVLATQSAQLLPQQVDRASASESLGTDMLDISGMMAVPVLQLTFAHVHSAGIRNMAFLIEHSPFVLSVVF